MLYGEGSIIDIQKFYEMFYFKQLTLYVCHFQETEAEIEDEVDILMSSDIVAAQMSTKQITFSRAQTGWIFRADKKVGWLAFKIDNVNDNLWVPVFR